MLFDIYQWKQKMFDGSFATFEKVKRREDTVTIVPITTNKKIISVHEEQAPKKLVLWDSLQPSGHIDWAHYIFIAYGCKKIRSQHLDAGEKIKTRNISFQQFLRLAARDDFRAKDVALKVFRTLTLPKGEKKLRKALGF
ncbi:MAG: hypothetical protein HYT82_00635 [Candidatus Harrisonbacteria bacterium]|nr:hypothetical protein [Candidatus Harrisonbacteria bacterium]